MCMIQKYDCEYIIALFSISFRLTLVLFNNNNGSKEIYNNTAFVKLEVYLYLIKIKQNNF